MSNQPPDLSTRLRGIADVFFEFHEDDQADVLAAADLLDRHQALTSCASLRWRCCSRPRTSPTPTP